MSYHSDFERFLHTTLSADALNKLINEDLPTILGSPHRRTKVVRNPARATNVELLQLADLLGIHPFELLKNYGVGADTLSILEKRTHQENFEMKQKQQAAA